MTVLTPSVFFLLSFLGADILFRFLEASAYIKRRTYRGSGAIGGFVTVYGILFGSYYKISRLGPTITCEGGREATRREDRLGEGKRRCVLI